MKKGSLCVHSALGPADAAAGPTAGARQNRRCWAPPAEFLIQRVWVGPEDVLPGANFGNSLRWSLQQHHGVRERKGWFIQVL